MTYSGVNYRNRVLKVLVFVLLSCLTLPLFAQKAEETGAKLQDKAIKVFLDVSGMYDEHIKREIPFVNYVRDQKQAQIYIMMTTQRTGSGGTEYTLFFIGQKNLEGQNDTLKYVSKQDDTEEIIRSGIVKVLKAGLMPEVAKTPLFKDMAISYRRKAAPTDVIDKWNNWVFNTGVNGFFNGEESRGSYNIRGYFSADRITPEWKISASVSTDYNEDNYKFENYKFKSIRRSHRFRGMVVKSINEHWSFGGFVSGNSSIYTNTKLGFGFSPALEFNIFPYSESTRREFRFLYRLGFTDIKYEEETIFNKLKERLFSQSLSTTIEMKEKWGSVSTTLTGSNYFHDFSKNNLSLSSNFNIRLFEGFSIDLFGSISYINDQLRLRKSDFSTEDVLLRQKELSTSYDYFASIGLRYTFGSIFSNVVNSRFGSGGGGRRIIIM